AAGQRSGEAGLCPADHLNGGARHQQARLRGGPHHLIDDVVGAVGRIGDAVAVEIEGGIVGPVIAAAVLGPVEIAGADVFHLHLIGDEGIAREGVASGPGGEVDADAAAFEAVVAHLVAVGVVDEEAFVGANAHSAPAGARVGRIGGAHVAVGGGAGLAGEPARLGQSASDHPVAGDLGSVDRVEQQPVVTVAVRDIAADRQAVREHHRITNGIIDGYVPLDHAVVGVHVMDGEAGLLHAVAAVGVLLRHVREDAVAAEADHVVLDQRAGGVPDRDAVPGLGLTASAAGDVVAAHHRTGGPLNADAVEIALEDIVLDQDLARFAAEVDARVDL